MNIVYRNVHGSGDGEEAGTEPATSLGSPGGRGALVLQAAQRGGVFAEFSQRLVDYLTAANTPYTQDSPAATTQKMMAWPQQRSAQPVA